MGRGAESHWQDFSCISLVEGRAIVRIGIRDRIVTIDIRQAILTTIVRITATAKPAKARTMSLNSATLYRFVLF